MIYASRRQNIPKPQDYKFSLDIPYDEADMDNSNENQALINNPHGVSGEGFQTQPSCWDSVNSMVNFMSCGLWDTEQVSYTSNGIHRSVQGDFNGGPAIVYNERLLSSFQIQYNTESSENKFLKFFRNANQSRQNKKPVLLILMENPSEENQVEFIVNHLLQLDNMLASMILESYSVIFMQKTYFYDNLNCAQTYFQPKPFDGEVCMYILFVKHKQTISIMHKIYQHDIMETKRLTKMLQEYLGLFHIVIEEDAAYR